MDATYHGYWYVEDPEFEHLVFIGSHLIPIAHIKAIGLVEEEVGFEFDQDDNEIPLFGFSIYLSDYKIECSPHFLAESWRTKEEAERHRLELALQIDSYYKKLVGSE